MASVLLFLLLLFPLSSTSTILYVIPTPHTPCPAHPCHTLSHYIENATKYFTFNTTMIFLPGDHTFKVQANVTNVTGFSMFGESEGTSMIFCHGSGCGGFYFENVSHLSVSNLSFISDSQSITAVHVYDFELVNCTFANSSNTALIVHNSILLLNGNTFVNNSGGRADQMALTAGGGIAAVSSHVTFQGQNVFLNNTCTADVCGGGAVYAENSNITLEGNTSFINNTAISLLSDHLSPFPSGGGGLFLLYTTIHIIGYVDFINNSASSAVAVELKCESCGGGALLVYSNTSISGTVTFSKNLINGESGCGGGICLYASSVTMKVTGSVLVTDNYAGYAGGGMVVETSFMNITGSVVLTNNSAGQLGGGVGMIDSSMNITGNVVLIDNYAGFQSGGIDVDTSFMTITGSVVLTNNSAGQYGGGVGMRGSSMKITGNMVLTKNYAGYQGGGMDMETSFMDITGSVVLTNNSAGQYGGGVIMIGSSMNITGNVLLTDNFAGIQGGGMDVDTSFMNLTGSVVLTNNSAGRHGGGVGMLGSSMKVTGSALLVDNYSGFQGGGMDVEASFMNITGSVVLTNNSAGQYGGGVSMIGSSMNVTVTGSVLLTDNYAGYQCGGMAVEKSFMNIIGSVVLTNNSAGQNVGGVGMIGSSMKVTGSVLLTNNYAGYQGGGMDVETSFMNITGTVSLTNNSAGQHGGGVVMIDSSIYITGSVLVTDNYAGNQGGGMSVDTSFMKITGSVLLTNNSGDMGGGVSMRASSMNITGTVLLTNNYAGFQGGGMDVETSFMNITGSVVLANNSAGQLGGGITMDIYSSSMKISGSISFNDNYALQGGGLYVGGFYIQLDFRGKVYFTKNCATWGGAIFVLDISPLVYCASDAGAECVIEDCFFQISENVSPYLDSLIVFKDNVAESGSVLFGGSVDRCRLEGHPEAHSGEVFDMITNYTEQPDTLSVISSLPFRVCLCEDNRPHCSDTQSGNVTAYPGQTFSITAAAVGQRDGTVDATISSIINPPETSRLAAFEDRQSVHARCTELHYTVFSSHSNNHLIMYVDASCSSLNDSVDLISLPVHLPPCPPAFILSESTYGCVCEERLQKYTNKCNINDQSILHEGDFWVGYDNQSQGLILHPHCPFDYCKAKLTYFTLSETDLQCEFDRTGLLCGACHPGRSLALGSSQCLPCSDIYLSLLLPFAVMGFVLVFFLLACKLTVAVGTINALVFYANIVGANRSLFSPPGSTNYLTLFIAWLNLDLGIETCFYDGMDTYVKTWLQFAFPIYIWAIVGLIIFISGHSRRISRMLGSNPVAVLATLILLSYSKIIRTIIAALSFTTLQYPNDETQVVWLYDANIRYLHGKHIPLFVVGLLAFTFLFLPYTLLLLLGQWLQAFSHLKILRWMNNQKLKAFLDVHYAPYKENHRYWTGFLLIVRFVLLLVFGSNALGDNSENLLAISAASFGLLVWMIGGVYQNWYLDALEASFVLNLGILAVATYYVQHADAGGNQDAVAYTSTSIAFATFVGIVLYHIYLETKESRFWRVICCRKNDQQQDNEWDGPEDSGDRPLVAPTTTYVSFGSCVQLREPLLDAQ